MKTKILKIKDFMAKGVACKHYSVAYKGRVFGVSTLRFDVGDLTVDADTLTIKGDLEVLKSTNTDPVDGTVKVFLDLVPKLDVLLASI